jgi:hypothetical protein
LLVLLTAFSLLAALGLPAMATAPRARAQSAPPPPADAVEVTNVANGQTLYIGVGQPLLVRLNSNNDWSIAVDDDTLLQAATPADGLPDGVQAEFSAIAPGMTTLRATGTAHCAPSQPCPQYAIQFSATIRIVPADTTVIGQDADGATISVAQGDTVFVQLDPRFLWTFTFTPNDVLVPVDVTVGLGPGVQYILLAQQTGSVEIEADGEPVRQPNGETQDYALRFSTTIVVQ